MGTPRSRTHRVGLLYLVLALATMAVAFAVSKHFHVARMAATAVSLLPTLPGLYLAWKAYAADRTEAGNDLSFTQTADLLADAVRRQWETEAQLRRLNDPHPLPVSWRAADAQLVEDWPLLEMTARSWPVNPPSDPADWGSGPADLAGSDRQIVEVLTRRVPTGRLVVLGQPGAGKTMLLVRLVQDLLALRNSGEPVPVLISLASWNPAEKDLHTWLIHRLTTDYPALKEPVSAECGALSRAQELLERRLLFLLLDGLDEIPDTVRGTSIAKINDALRPGERLVLSCRGEQYRNTVHPLGGAPVVLRGAAGITLRELAGADIATYLRRDAGGDTAAARWDPVLACLHTGAPVARALRTPLMVGLARTIYNPRPGEHTAALSDPAELCDASRYRTPAEVEARLLDAFIPAAYRPYSRRPSRWTADQAERAFVYLARHLDRTLEGTVDLAWWELSRATPRYLTLIVSGLILGSFFWLTSGIADRSASVIESGLVGGLLGGVVGGLTDTMKCRLWQGQALAMKIRWNQIRFVAGLRFGFAGGLALGLMLGLAGGLLGGLVAGVVAVVTSLPGQGPMPTTGIRWNWKRFALGLAGGLVAGMVFDLVAVPGFALARGLTIGLAVGLLLGLERSPADITTTAGPAVLLARDRNAFQVTIVAIALVFGLVFGVMNGLAVGLAVGLAFGVVFGLVGGLTVGLIVGLTVSLTVGLIAGPGSLTEGGLRLVLESGFTHGFTSGTAVGLMSGIASGVGANAWRSFTIARLHLALRGYLPFRLMSFLIDAHEQHGVLRQVGPVYQFRHVELQRRLADRIF